MHAVCRAVRNTQKIKLVVPTLMHSKMACWLSSVRLYSNHVMWAHELLNMHHEVNPHRRNSQHTSKCAAWPGRKDGK